MPSRNILFSLLQKNGAVAATHSGSFHADDVFSAAALRLVSPSVRIVRTRDPMQWAKSDILFDVGGAYDVSACRFDHHQKGYDEKRENGIPFSSFGLIWKELGSSLCESGAASDKVDRFLVQGIDAIDCGVTLTSEIPCVNVMSISQAIAGFNPSWREDRSADALNAAFERAVSVAAQILKNAISEANSLEKARAEVNKGVVLEEGRILLLDSNTPWQEAVLGDSGYAKVWYVVLPDVSAGWKIQAVPERAGSFKNRKSLPENWAGLEGEELDFATGIEGGIFCHRGRFTAGHGQKEGALAMARLAVLA